MNLIINRGFSLIELMISGALVLILTGVAVPGVAGQWQEWQLRQLAMLALSDFTRLRDYAVHQEKGIFIRPDEGGWCAGYSNDVTQACGLSQFSLPERFRFRHSMPDGRFMFTAERGFARSGGTTLFLSSLSSDSEVRLIISALGRVRICSNNPIRGISRCE